MFPNLKGLLFEQPGPSGQPSLDDGLLFESFYKGRLTVTPTSGFCSLVANGLSLIVVLFVEPCTRVLSDRASVLD